MSYDGNVGRIRFGVRGQSGSRNQSNILHEHMVTTKNIDMSEGIIRKEGGVSNFTSADAHTGTSLGVSIDILGGVDYEVDSSTQRNVVAVSSGDVLLDSGTGKFATLLAAGRNDTNRTFLTQGGNESQGRAKKLFVCNAINTVMVVSGDATSTGDISGPAADWTGTTQPVKLVPHRGRMWGWLNDRIYYSDADNHELFLTSLGTGGSFSAWPGTGGGIRDAISFKGRLFFFKDNFIGWIDDSSTTLSEWFVDKLTDSIGIAGTDCVDLIDDDVVFLSPEGGVHLLSAVQKFGDMENSDLAIPDEMNQYMRANINFGQISASTVKYYSARKQIHLAVPTGSSSVPNQRIIIDMNGKIPRWHVSDRDTMKSMWMFRDSSGVERPMIGDTEGHVLSLDQEGRTHELTGAYEASFQTSHTDFSFLDPGLANKRKNFDFLELKFEQIGAWFVPVEIYIDGTKTQTINFKMSSGVSELGSFVLGTDRLLGILNSPPSVRRVRIKGSGQFFGIKPISTGDSEEFLLSEARVYFTVSDERL